jgi:deoxyribonuclease I
MLKTKTSVFIVIFFCANGLFADENSDQRSWFTVTLNVLQIYSDHRFTFYCGCPYTQDKVPETQGCYTPQSFGSSRATRIEIEHVVPATDFGRSFSEWGNEHEDCKNSDGAQISSRGCLYKINQKYRKMHDDLHNLVPEIGELNNLRSNYRLDMVGESVRSFQPCQVKIGFRSFEPPDNVKGDVARIYFYMDKKFPGRGIVGDKNKKLFQAWDKLDPVDKWECIRDKRIFNLQGDHNSFVYGKCQ